ncbi:MAG: hypothetical protein AAGJ12_12315 [Bacteroidota bacterium]
MNFNSYWIPSRPDKCISASRYNKDYFPQHEKDKYLPDGTINIVFELTDYPKYIYGNTTGKIKRKCSNFWFLAVPKDYITISKHHKEMMVLVSLQHAFH